ncbi:MAG TPA: SusD/RagB family nutrient-binding outer membrane lipoprotein [Puia sp.]|nr:SusD/RagB family nutrient-binding outer membrane lipoprotein [Puia sp.]
MNTKYRQHLKRSIMIVGNKIIIASLAATLLLGACQKNITGLNTDTKNPLNAPSYSLFTDGQKYMTDWLTTTDVNYNIGNLVAQYWTETTYTDESNYNLGNRDIPKNFWTRLYVDALNNYEQAKKLIPTDVLDSGQARSELDITDIMEVYTYYYLVTTFGNLPYTQANDIDKYPFPAYDDAKTVYSDLLTRLDSSIAGLNATGGSSFGAADIIYGGDVPSWLKFANSLKLKMAMLLADTDPATAQTKVSEAVTAGVFTSNADNALFRYTGVTPNANPIWVAVIQSNRNDFVIAKTLLNSMVTLDDPRGTKYWTNEYSDDNIGGSVGDNNTWNNYSNIYWDNVKGTIVDPAAPSDLLDYSEVSFLLAEAVERGFITGTAADYYNAGVTASIEYWGGSEAAANAYLAQSKVAYATAPGGVGVGAIGTTGVNTAGDHWKQAIGMQKYIALYVRGMDAWVDIRRLHYPAMAVPTDAKTPFPWRYTYPSDEQTANGGSYKAAVTAIGGNGDQVTTKLFWMQ